MTSIYKEKEDKSEMIALYSNEPVSKMFSDLIEFRYKNIAQILFLPKFVKVVFN
jgi:hypothetical protein